MTSPSEPKEIALASLLVMHAGVSIATTDGDELTDKINYLNVIMSNFYY